MPGFQSGSVSNVNKVNNPGNTFVDHNSSLESPEGICKSVHCLNNSGPAVPNQPEDSFQPAPLELEEGEPDTGTYIPALQVTMKNIHALKSATLEESGMAPDNIEQLRDPEQTRCSLDMSDTHLVKALRHFIYSTDTSCNHYEIIRKVDMAAYPGDDFLSFDQAKRTLKKVSGVVPMRHDMCMSSCAAFTGTYSDLEAYPYCSAPRYLANGQPH